KQRGVPQPTPPAPPSPATAPAEEPARAVTPAFSNVRAEAEESAAATPAAPAPPVRRQLAVPAYQRNRQPEYPPMARRRGYSGTVMLKVLVDAQGQVAGLTVEQSSGHHILDEEALKSVRQWLFSPATEDGTPVSMWVSVPITFQLQDQ
ncbi:MAG: energy transducer TonB, partial [Deltaproteobacteria bacterium]